MTTTPEVQEIVHLFKYCRQAFLEAGMTLSFPPGTDPRKTYKWRYLDNFHRCCVGLRIPNNLILPLLRLMVAQAKRQGVLKQRGLAILVSEKLIEDAFKKLEHDRISMGSVVRRVSEDNGFLDTFIDRTKALMSKARPNASPNIVIWYLQGKLSPTVLALSRSCGQAISQLDTSDRSLLPKNLELIGIRRRCATTVDIKYKLKQIMGSDWGVYGS